MTLYYVWQKVTHFEASYTFPETHLQYASSNIVPFRSGKLFNPFAFCYVSFRFVLFCFACTIRCGEKCLASSWSTPGSSDTCTLVKGGVIRTVLKTYVALFLRFQRTRSSCSSTRTGLAIERTERNGTKRNDICTITVLFVSAFRQTNGIVIVRSHLTSK